MELYFSAGVNFNSSNWPWLVVFGKNLYLWKTTFLLKMTWHKIGPSKNHISLSYTPGHGISNDTKYSVVYSSHLGMVGTRIWCVISERAIFVGLTSGRPDKPVFEQCQTLLHPELTPGWSFLLADGDHHKKPHSPTHPNTQLKVMTIAQGQSWHWIMIKMSANISTDLLIHT